MDDKWIEEAILDGPVQDYMNGWKDFLGDVICLDYNEFGGRNRKMKGRQKINKKSKVDRPRRDQVNKWKEVSKGLDREGERWMDG